MIFWCYVHHTIVAPRISVLAFKCLKSTIKTLSKTSRSMWECSWQMIWSHLFSTITTDGTVFSTGVKLCFHWLKLTAAVSLQAADLAALQHLFWIIQRYFAVCIQLRQDRASENRVAKERSSPQDRNPSVALMTDFKKGKLLSKLGKSQLTHCYTACEFLEREEKGRMGRPCTIF